MIKSHIKKDILLNPEDLKEFIDALKAQIVQHTEKIKQLRSDADDMEVTKNNYESKLALLLDWQQMLDHADFAMMRQTVEEFKAKRQGIENEN